MWALRCPLTDVYPFHLMYQEVTVRDERQSENSPPLSPPRSDLFLPLEAMEAAAAKAAGKPPCALRILEYLLDGLVIFDTRL